MSSPLQMLMIGSKAIAQQAFDFHNERFLDRISIFCWSKTNVGRNSFPGKFKLKCDNIPFEWLDMSLLTFDLNIR